MCKCLKSKELKALQDTAQGAGTKDGPSQPGKRKDKCTPLDPPLKQSIKGSPFHLQRVPLPPPLTSTPLLPKALSVNAPQLSTLVQMPNPSKNATMVQQHQHLHAHDSNLFPLQDCCSLFFHWLIFFVGDPITSNQHLSSHYPESHSPPNQSKTPETGTSSILTWLCQCFSFSFCVCLFCMT